MNTAASPGRLTTPKVDLHILDGLVADPRLGIAGTLELFRGQTSQDFRPNKALRSWLYRLHLSSYPQLGLLCNIAENGLVPHWVDPVLRTGVRPSPPNYPGATQGASIVTHKLLADYYHGRCIVATLATLEADPGFHASPFALVPKKDLPLDVDGRIIHDLSAPTGLSVNDHTDSSMSPDATWDPFYMRVMHPRSGGNFRSTNHGIVSGMAVFGWTASPGFFAVFGKLFDTTSVRWVDDIVLIEVDIGDRLKQAETRLRDGIKLVFGSDGWHEGKFRTWSREFHAAGIDWDIPSEVVSVPQRKIDKTKAVVLNLLGKRAISRKQLDSLVGVLRHVISFIPITKPFIQSLVAVQNSLRRLRQSVVSLTEFLKKDLVWWSELVFQNEFRGMPMRLFDTAPSYDEVWLKTQQLKRASVAEGTLGRYTRNFKFWESFCTDFGFPVWIDELPRAQQARMVGLFAGVCASEGHNRSKIGNKYQTFDGKMAAVVFAQKAVRNARLNYHDPEFDLIAQGYKRTNSQVERKQPVTTQMLLKIYEQIDIADSESRLVWDSIVMGFYFLDRSSELWGPVPTARSGSGDRVHCVPTWFCEIAVRYRPDRSPTMRTQ
ncbi:hypothetical protein PHYSODRAFT_342227 [Phytophthora sojae]|uniref:Reverse transcriptase domain-containing protein n=1 Tax=Phytophthora sojae (strain P6497) TaxID=1094619 RepID=G5AGD7_PHYSP|nr:hypothetical protein PHYSODRAFT_342227 [Phytophthora sojae]EGZ05377.1 hypothetical protein PHYSODRAFT_342227 [Phytophthora sojae]|eukprot:XP_009538908.1 hypothetical protein PHYSODRAFT_342227 [Phytophthora sojae]